MTDPTRGTRSRRATRRPGWALMTTLLVLAILASSALVFTNRVELLKLAVIVALWAAVVAAFVSFIYRRQADVDSARARDLKLVYDLQLDREISARREYELSVESAVRRELASEMQSQAADEVASLRAELAALRANLEILFDTDLAHRPALETERSSVHGFADWDGADGASDRERFAPGRVISSRIDTEDADATDPNTEESPIIDVPVEPPPAEPDWAVQPAAGAHRRPSEVDPASRWQAPAPVTPPPPPVTPVTPTPPPVPPPPPPQPTWTPEPAPAPAASGAARPWLPSQPPVSAPPTTPPASVLPPPPPPPPPVQQPAARSPWQEPERPGRHTSDPEPAVTSTGWRPVPAEGEFIPAGTPGSNWVAPTVDNGAELPSPPAVPLVPPAVTSPPSVTPPPAMAPPSTEPGAGGRHWTPQDPAASEPARRARHSSPGQDPGRPSPPTLATAAPPTPREPEKPRPSRHRGPEEPQEREEPSEPEGQHSGGLPASELLARLQGSSTGGGRRRRREE
ncbi:DUF6779 domain-containing protein [Mycolicibacterium sp. 624]|uniref:DUF6779 domain-containing protein n=1 Tax=Mycolicibacterium sp. 624 TaxID=3156314 RepID=UPI0033967D5F